jgi:hypothetical protein
MKIKRLSKLFSEEDNNNGGLSTAGKLGVVTGAGAMGLSGIGIGSRIQNGIDKFNTMTKNVASKTGTVYQDGLFVGSNAQRAADLQKRAGSMIGKSTARSLVKPGLIGLAGAGLMAGSMMMGKKENN